MAERGKRPVRATVAKMTSPSSLASESSRILQLARHDRRAATEALAGLRPEQQMALVCEAPLARRSEILELMPTPEVVIPLIPDAELCFLVKAIGLHDSGWVLEHATNSQIVASVDLDAWSELLPDRELLSEWVAALAEAGEPTLLRSAQSLDPELLVLLLRERVTVIQKPAADDAQSWEAPIGGHTVEGQFYLVPREEGDDIAPVLSLLDTLFRKDYWLYFRMLQGAIWELDPELEEWSLRWRTGRLEDLGFPPWDEAMRIYGFVRPDRRADIPESETALDIAQWDMPVWIPQLPAAEEHGYSVFRAAAALVDEERSAFFYAFIALSNKIAVADRMPLGDAETTPRAIQKAAAVVSRGLDYIAGERHCPAEDVLRRASLERLFQVGASLAREEDRA